MNETIPLPIEGTLSETTVPDTLDLAGRARLAVHGILGSIDPELLTMYGLVFSGLDAPCEITLTFPVVETTARYAVAANTPAEHAYTCTFRGSTCVDVSPKDTAPTSYPFYDRTHLRADQTPVKQVKRFVADRIVGAW